MGTTRTRCEDRDCFFIHGYHCHACGLGFETMSEVCSHTKTECLMNPTLRIPGF